MQSWLFDTNKNIESKIKYEKNNPEQFMDVAAVKVLPENARDFYAISYFDAKNAHTQISVSRSEERVVLCLATPVWQSSDTHPRAWRRSNNFRHTCPNVSVTLSSSICDPMKWLRYDCEKSYCSNHVTWPFWCSAGFSIVAVIFV